MIKPVKCQDQSHVSNQSQSKEITPQKRKQGVWDQEEVLKFMIFARYKIKVLTSKLQRRTNKIFKEMAKFVITRSPTQCRSQNQKLLKKYRNFRKMIKSYEVQIGKQEFQEQCLQYENQINALNRVKKNKNSRLVPIKVSKLTQTDFSSNSSSEENQQVKVEEQKNYNKQQAMDMQLPFFPFIFCLPDILPKKQD